MTPAEVMALASVELDRRQQECEDRFQEIFAAIDKTLVEGFSTYPPRERVAVGLQHLPHQGNRHVLGDVAIDRIIEHFVAQGWTVARSDARSPTTDPNLLYFSPTAPR